jgi:hypothetical protein
MATSATCTYSAVQTAGVYDYEVKLRNTSPAPFSIYGFLFGQQFDVPIQTLLPLQNVALTQAPAGWSGDVGLYYIDWQTNWQGSALATGYIMPSQVGTFKFQSSTAPPSKLPFGAVFYDNTNEWGFEANGTAELKHQSEPIFSIPSAYNPWWWIETHGGLVPPGPPPPWIQELRAAITLAENAGRASPQLRARLLQVALEQTSIAAATMRRQLQALNPN